MKHGVMLVVSLVSWVSVIAAQAVPALGADRLIGSAGMETFVAGTALGMSPNPGAIAAEHGWSVGFGVSGNSVTDVSERSVAGSFSLGRAGIGVRGTSRRVQNLFDDPTLENGSDLRVQDTEFILGVSVEVLRELRVGASGYFVSSEVLGTTGEGTGYKLGLQLTLPWLATAVTYGVIETTMGWQAINGPQFRSPGTERLAVGLQTPELVHVPLKPRVTAEVDIDRGLNSDAWLRGNLSLSPVAWLHLLGGWAVSTEYQSQSYSEIGVLLGLDRFDLELGLRFGADPVPGNSHGFGGQVHSQ